MVRKLRWQFISVSLSALFFAIVLVQSFVIIMTRSNIESLGNRIIEEIIRRKGVIDVSIIDNDIRKEDEELARILYNTRYLIGWLEESEDGIQFEVTNTTFLNSSVIEDIALEVWGTKSEGNMEHHGLTYAYRYEEVEGRYLFVIVDISSRIELVSSLTGYMLMVGIIIMLFYFFLIVAYSRKIVRPYEEAQEKQKRFITNASHELKTPLAVIQANTDMLEMMHGSNKWVESNIRQIERMNRLVAELVSLVRLEEKGEITLNEVGISSIVTEACDNFEQVIKGKGKDFHSEVENGIYIKGEEKSMVELVDILLDNASKYCDEGGRVDLKLSKSGKKMQLVVSNTYAEGKGVDYNKFFERFYREDTSHNSSKKGYGIGLAIAKQICEKLGGTLNVSYKEDTIHFIVGFGVIK